MEARLKQYASCEMISCDAAIADWRCVARDPRGGCALRASRTGEACRDGARRETPLRSARPGEIGGGREFLLAQARLPRGAEPVQRGRGRRSDLRGRLPRFGQSVREDWAEAEGPRRLPEIPRRPAFRKRRRGCQGRASRHESARKASQAQPLRKDGGQVAVKLRDPQKKADAGSQRSL